MPRPRSRRKGAAPPPSSPSSHVPNYQLIGELTARHRDLVYLGEMVFGGCSLPVVTIESLMGGPAPARPSSNGHAQPEPQPEPRPEPPPEPPPHLSSSPPLPSAPSERPQYVTLDQCASIINRSKRTLEDYRDKMPPPDVEGGGGRPHEWIWPNVRPWLEAYSRRKLPERYPEF